MMLDFDQPGVGGGALVEAAAIFGAQFGVAVQLCFHVEREQIGAGAVIGAGIGNRAGAHADIAARHGRIDARASVPLFTACSVVQLVIDHDELRVEIVIAAQHRGFEGDRARQQIDFIIDITQQRAARDDHFRAEPVTHFERHHFAAGDDCAAGQAVWAGNAAALIFIAAVLGGDLGGKALRVHAAGVHFALEASGAALIAGQLALIEATLKIAIDRVERAGFDPHVQLLTAGGVAAAIRTIGEHSVISARIDRTHQHLIVALLGAVIAGGEQILAQHAALHIDRGAGMIAQIAVEPARAFHVVGHGSRTDRTFDQPDHGPRLVTRDHPGIEFLAAALLAVAEVEFHVELAADHGRGELDIGDAVVALDRPARSLTA